MTFDEIKQALFRKQALSRLGLDAARVLGFSFLGGTYLPKILGGTYLRKDAVSTFDGLR